MRTWIPVALLLGAMTLAAGCGPAGGDGHAPPRSDPGIAATAQEIRGCASDADCVLSYLNDRSCCGYACDPGAARNRTFEARLKAHQATACVETMPQCPAYACEEPDEMLEAVCVNALCEIRRTPIDRGPAPEGAPDAIPDLLSPAP